MKIRGFEKISLEQWNKDSDSIVKYVNMIKFANKEEPIKQEDTYNKIKLPLRGTKHSAGYDVYAPFKISLFKGDSIKIPTGIKAYMQEDEYISIYPRSSMGFKHFMRLANTVAIGDSDYYNNSDNEGHYWIYIRNEGKENMIIEEGQAFAQCIFHKYLTVDDDYSNLERTGGIGSTDA